MNLRKTKDLESARQARRSVNLVRLQLLNPTAKTLERCTPHLRVAIEALERLERAIPGGMANEEAKLLSGEMGELRRELGQLNALMKQAAEFHGALAELLSTEDTSVHYIAKGVIPMRPVSRMLAEG